jgi:hypothetical protein
MAVEGPSSAGGVEKSMPSPFKFAAKDRPRVALDLAFENRARRRGEAAIVFAAGRRRFARVPSAA